MKTNAQRCGRFSQIFQWKLNLTSHLHRTVYTNYTCRSFFKAYKCLKMSYGTRTGHILLNKYFIESSGLIYGQLEVQLVCYDEKMLTSDLPFKRFSLTFLRLCSSFNITALVWSNFSSIMYLSCFSSAYLSVHVVVVSFKFCNFSDHILFISFQFWKLSLHFILYIHCLCHLLIYVSFLRV